MGDEKHLAELRKKYNRLGLQWKLDGKPAYQAKEVQGGGYAAEWFLEGYNDYGALVAARTLAKEFE